MRPRDLNAVKVWRRESKLEYLRSRGDARQAALAWVIFWLLVLMWAGAMASL